jgi:ribonucleotide reductase beta subunit family protein with ferritin-like domain
MSELNHECEIVETSKKNNRPRIVIKSKKNTDKPRLVVYPIKNKPVWDMYQKQQSCFWTVGEIDFSKDYKSWQQLTDKEQHFIKYILGFFAASDGIVNMNLAERFLNDTEELEVRTCYQWQIAMENIHAECYSLMIDTYIKDNKEKEFLLDAIENIPSITKKANWALKWIEDKQASFAQRLLAFACVEGIFFSGSFCAIYWLKERNLMPGLCISNEFIARDEGMHCDFACMQYLKQPDKLPFEKVKELFEEVVEIESDFITESIPCKLIGMNSEHMIQYIKFVADRLLVDLNYPKIYKASNPFSFMENISLEGKTNFFEHRPTQYKKANVSDSSFEISDDF